MKMKFRQRIASRQAAKAEIAAEVVEIANKLFRDRAEYVDYLTQNGFSNREAERLADEHGR